MLALAGMRQTALGQYLKVVHEEGFDRMGFMVQKGLSIYALTELLTQHTLDLHVLTQNSVKSAL